MFKDDRINFQYVVDLDYNSGSNFGCTCEDVCRCSRISGARVNSVNVQKMVSTFLSVRKLKPSIIEEYCIDRIFTIRKAYEPDRFDIKICNGYYGEEIGKVTWDQMPEVEREVMNLLKYKSDKKKIDYVLTLEYGYLLEDLKDKSYTDKKISKNDLVFAQREYIKKINRQLFYVDYPYPRGIVIENGNKFRLIDGYHRCLSCEKDKINVIVAY